MREYLIASSFQDDEYIKNICIDDCGMTDSQFATILEGIKHHKKRITSITYSTGQLGRLSEEELIQLVPYLEELCLINLSGGGLKVHICKILKAID